MQDSVPPIPHLMELFASTQQIPIPTISESRNDHVDVGERPSHDQLLQIISKKEAELEESRATGREFEIKCQSLESRLADYQIKSDFELQAARTRYGTAEKRLLEREAEMATLKAYLSNHNDSSDEDVNQLLETVNDLIENLAERGAMEWAMEASNNHDIDISVEGDRRDLKGIIGLSLFKNISRSSAPNSPSLLLQFTWQACIVYSCHWALTQFSLPLTASGAGKKGGPNKIVKILGQVHEEIGNREVQTVQSRWRSVTHQYLRLVVPKETVESLTSDVIEDAWFRCRFATAMALKSSCLNTDKFATTFKDSMQEIMDLVLKLIIMIREQVATKNFQPSSPAQQKSFESASMNISEAMANEPRYVRSGAEVACATRIGLSYTSQGVGNGPVLVHLFKKPSVVTQYAIEDLVRSESRSSIREGGPNNNRRSNYRGRPRY